MICRCWALQRDAELFPVSDHVRSCRIMSNHVGSCLMQDVMVNSAPEGKDSITAEDLIELPGFFSRLAVARRTSFD